MLIHILCRISCLQHGVHVMFSSRRTNNKDDKVGRFAAKTTLFSQLSN